VAQAPLSPFGQTGEVIRRVVIVLIVGVTLSGVTTAARATFPFPGPAAGVDVYDYSRLHIKNGACTGPLAATADLPKGFSCTDTFKLTDYAAQPGDQDYSPLIASNPQELFGVKGMGTNRAWEETTGRPDTVIALMDSGIEWGLKTPELVNKFFLNRGELPVPCSGMPCTTQRGGSLQAYDVNHDGVFNVADYAHDPRVKDFSDDGNDYVDPGDLIRTFSDGKDDDHNGYVDDISGWDFYQADNNASDDVTYGHGTGESRDSSAEIEKQVTECPNCMLLELRVGDSFIADINHWAQAVVYGVDNGASVVQEALGTENHTGFAQAAADYAYRHGVLIVASEADEEAGHHNYPAALNHTMVVNSLDHFVDTVQQAQPTYLNFNGCTNFGGYTWVSVESASCSSDATGQSSGIAGLLYSAARNAIQRGVMAPDASGRPLSAEEAKQLFRLSADDVDFSTPRPPGGPNNFVSALPATQRYVTTAGWDQITGWGRLNAHRLVLDLVRAGHIPPEADVTSPRWWQPLGTSGHVDVVGSVAAPRAASYTYEVAYAPGVQPPRWPLTDTWTTLLKSGPQSAPKQGVLATVDLAAVRAAIAAAPPVYTPVDDPTAYDHPEKDAFRVRVIVHADGDTTTPWKTAIEQREYFSHDDPDLLAGFPRYLDADGAGSPAFADIDGDGTAELVLTDGNGFVHAFRPDGGEMPGWPVHTEALPLPKTSPQGFAGGEVHTPVYAPLLLGSPTIADLDGDGWPEVAVADVEGWLHVWHHDGHAAAGFPVQVNRAWSEVPGCQTNIGPQCDEFVAHPVRDHVNTVDHAFTSNPAAGDIDPSHPGLELVVGSNDDHVYAWHGDGTPVAGWPVLLRDPAKVASVDPVSQRITFKPDAQVKYGKQVLATPSIGDVDGDGVPEVAVNVDEEYGDTPNISIVSNPLGPALAQAGSPGNTRTYLLFHDGTLHAPTPGRPVLPNLGNNAYMPGWPVAVEMANVELLPDVGSGSDGSPTLADVNGDGKPEIATASILSPPYLFNADGTSYYGNGPDGLPLTMQSTVPGPASTATDMPSLVGLGGGVFGRLGGPGSALSWAAGSGGLRRLLDVVLPEQQLGAEDHVGAWDANSGRYQPGFPALMNDLQFFLTPAIADVSGDGQAEVLQSSAMYDLRAYGLGASVPAGWPKFTGGWSVVTPAVGDFGGDGHLDIALITREGNLFVWRTAGAACQPAEWPKFQHDLRNSGNYATDGSPPGVVTGLHVDGGAVSFVSSGGDGRCGKADAYKVTVGGRSFISSVLPLVAGTPQTIPVGVVPADASVSVQAVDGAGNLSPPVVLAARAVRGQAVGQLPATGGRTSDLRVELLLLALALASVSLRRRHRHTHARRG